MKKKYFAPKTENMMMDPEPIMGVGSTREIQTTQDASNYSREGGSFWDDAE